jgi:hypothetical protein
MEPSRGTRDQVTEWQPGRLGQPSASSPVLTAAIRAALLSAAGLTGIPSRASARSAAA